MGYPKSRPYDSAHYSGSSGSEQSPNSQSEGIPWLEDEDILAIPHGESSIGANADSTFPSPFTFNTMVRDYLKNLSPKKREKALLTQAMYDAVMAVLSDPGSTSIKTAQFRFWAKKMFSLTSFGHDTVICHDGKPVAVKEQIYEVLTHCHAQASHGGRDKTSAQVRKYYSWIPKEIIARFVRDCPFCQNRRTSSSSHHNLSNSQAFFKNMQEARVDPDGTKTVTLEEARRAAMNNGLKPHTRKSNSSRTVASRNQLPANSISYQDQVYDQTGSAPSMQMSRRTNSVYEQQYMSTSQDVYRRSSEHGYHPYARPGYLAAPRPTASRTSSQESDATGFVEQQMQQIQLNSQAYQFDQNLFAMQPAPYAPVAQDNVFANGLTQYPGEIWDGSGNAVAHAPTWQGYSMAANAPYDFQQQSPSNNYDTQLQLDPELLGAVGVEERPLAADASSLVTQDSVYQDLLHAQPSEFTYLQTADADALAAMNNFVDGEALVFHNDPQVSQVQEDTTGTELDFTQSAYIGDFHDAFAQPANHEQVQAGNTDESDDDQAIFDLMADSTEFHPSL